MGATSSGALLTHSAGRTDRPLGQPRCRAHQYFIIVRHVACVRAYGARRRGRTDLGGGRRTSPLATERSHAGTAVLDRHADCRYCRARTAHVARLNIIVLVARPNIIVLVAFRRTYYYSRRRHRRRHHLPVIRSGPFVRFTVSRVPESRQAVFFRRPEKR